MVPNWLNDCVGAQAHVKLLEVADSVSLEEVNAIGASVLSYISHYRNEAALLEEVGPDPVSKGYAQPGPSRMTSIVACVPAFMDASGQSTGVQSPTVALPVVCSQVMPVHHCQVMLVADYQFHACKSVAKLCLRCTAAGVPVVMWALIGCV